MKSPHFINLPRLAVASCAVLCSALSSFAQGAVRDDAASEKLGIKLSLQCYTYRALTFFETVDKAAALGVKYLEIYPGQTIQPGSDEKIAVGMSDATWAAIQAKLAAAGGLKLVAFGVAPIPDDEAGARAMFQWAKKLGLEVLVTETVPTAVHDQLCEEFQIRMALHNHPTSWPPEQVLEAARGHSKLIGACADTGHWMRRRLVPVEQLKRLEGRIEHGHFKDLNTFGKGEDLPWGTGQGDAQGMLSELKRQGYHGYLSIEYEVGSVSDLDTNLPKCVEFFDRTLGELAK